MHFKFFFYLCAVFRDQPQKFVLMDKANILYIAQEITPFVEENPMSKICRYLPQGILEKGKEVRVFMPRFGLINERRNQLHEVIRLSGMNIIIDDTDHSLIIKVTSIQQARMQVYFVDNEEYFKHKSLFTDPYGNFFENNDERMIFYNRGVVETTKKLRWSPDIIHCHGWMAAFTPLFTKRMYKDEPLFKNAKVIYTLYDHPFEGTINTENIRKKMGSSNIRQEHLKLLNTGNFNDLQKLAIKYSDAIIQGSENISEELLDFAKSEHKPILEYHDEETYLSAHNELYDQLLK